MSGGEIYIEILQSGSALEIVAIDRDSLTEVRFIAPASTPEADIKALARAKMNYVLSRGGEEPRKPDNKRGIIV
ncbi:MAG: hypothetical protein CMK06_12530 [Ponticaulis sp.]|nr:hypothetical protein [Ponticaulis sp.]